jgi:glutaryl-CoA dehydrogenase
MNTTETFIKTNTEASTNNNAEALTKSKPVARPLPKPDADFYHLTEILNDKEKAKLEEVRVFMKTKVSPVINKYWADASFPFELIPGCPRLKYSR